MAGLLTPKADLDCIRADFAVETCPPLADLPAVCVEDLSASGGLGGSKKLKKKKRLSPVMAQISI
jgi:hypothetical protein